MLNFVMVSNLSEWTVTGILLYVSLIVATEKNAYSKYTKGDEHGI